MKLNPDEAVLCLGSNFNGAFFYLSEAEKKIRALKNTRVLKKTRVLRTKPVMADKNQKDYANRLLKIKTPLAPLTLLKKLQVLETALFRKRKGEKLSRTIDIDIILFGNYNLTMKELCLPIKNLKKRSYVMRLLKEL